MSLYIYKLFFLFWKDDEIMADIKTKDMKPKTVKTIIKQQLGQKE